jgi:1,5-anhydro-D-fructose reductase (1,5-anhydro-D-mannitol-forming)
MINVGIIGFGKMGRIRYKTIRDSSRGGRIIAISEPSDVSGEWGEASFVSTEEIIQSEKIDALFICTPNYLNKGLTIKGLRAGKHIFCEKPPAFTPEEVKEIRKEEKKSGKKLMYGFNHRHHSSVKYIKNLIDSEEYGKILWMRGRYGKSVDKTFYDSWRSRRELAGGGILLDQGIHMLDLFLFLGGQFDKVHAFVSNRYWEMDIEDNVFAILKNSNTGIVASLHSTMTQWRHLFSLEIFLSRGYIVLNGLKTSSNTYGDEVLSIAKNRSAAPAATWEDEEKITFDVDRSWRSEIDHFFDAIQSNKPIKTGNSDDALNVMNTIKAIYNSDNEYGR